MIVSIFSVKSTLLHHHFLKSGNSNSNFHTKKNTDFNSLIFVILNIYSRDFVPKKPPFLAADVEYALPHVFGVCRNNPDDMDFEKNSVSRYLFWWTCLFKGKSFEIRHQAQFTLELRFFKSLQISVQSFRKLNPQKYLVYLVGFYSLMQVELYLI